MTNNAFIISTCTEMEKLINAIAIMAACGATSSASDRLSIMKKLSSVGTNATKIVEHFLHEEVKEIVEKCVLK